MKIAILGFGEQGRAAYKYWNTSENDITIHDVNPDVAIPEGAKAKLGPDYLQGLEHYDLLVRIPSLHPRDLREALADNPEVLNRITTVTNEFFRVCPTANIIGVTGTKGKGTTSTLIAKMLEAAGKKVHLGGNIGIPPLDMLKNDIKPDDWVVLELANFQLIDLLYSPPIAVCLMVTSEHMDWHTDMDEYVTAKQQLFKWQRPGDIAVYYADNEYSKKIADASNGKKIPYMHEPGAFVKDGAVIIGGHVIIDTDHIKLLGTHNWQNVCAAVTAVWQITQDVAAIRSVLASFTGLEHRLELVRELDGAKYYDDSFGTTPETAIVAIEAFREPKVVILGGSDKGAEYTELARTVASNNVKHVITIGDTGPKIAETLRSEGYDTITEGGTTMPEIVQKARELASAGDIVLLSTGCASFGLFKNYKDRGNQFKQAVQALA